MVPAVLLAVLDMLYTLEALCMLTTGVLLLRLAWDWWRCTASMRRVDSFYELHARDMERIRTEHGEVLVLNANKEHAGKKGRPALLFVHGVCARMGQFEQQIAHFVNKGYHVVAFDNLGCGRSDIPRNPDSYRVQQFVDTCATVADKVFTPDERVVLVGHSFGSYLCLKAATVLAAAAPERVAGTVHMGAKAWWLENPALLQAKLRIFSLPTPMLWLIRPVLGMGFRSMAIAAETPAELVRQEAEASSRNPVYMFKAFYSRFHEVVALAPPVLQEHPVLVISGEQDKLAPHAQSEALAQLHANATHKIVKEASHQVQQEQPHVVNTHIEEYVVKTFL